MQAVNNAVATKHNKATKAYQLGFCACRFNGVQNYTNNSDASAAKRSLRRLRKISSCDQVGCQHTSSRETRIQGSAPIRRPADPSHPGAALHLDFLEAALAADLIAT